MQKIKYGEQEFNVKSITANDYRGIDTIEITFSEDTAFAEIQTFYDADCVTDTLRRMEVYNEIVTYIPSEDEGAEPMALTSFELQGIHIGYTKPVDISCFSGVLKVKIEKELEVESHVAQLQNEVDILVIGQLESEGIL